MIRALIKELGKTHTVIFSSHILSEVQTICDQILIIAKGKLIAFDGPEQLEKRLLAPGEILITVQMEEEEIRYNLKPFLRTGAALRKFDKDVLQICFLYGHFKEGLFLFGKG